MAITLVASVTAGPAPTGGSTAAIDTTGATLLIVSVAWWGGAGGNPVVSDSKGNVWIPLTAVGFGPTGVRLFYCLTPTVGSGHTFTVGSGGTFFYPSILAYAFSGVDSYQIQSGAGGSTSPLASGSVTPASPGALVFTGRAGNAAAVDTVAPAGFTSATVTYIGGGPMQGSAAYFVAPTAAAINPTWSWTGSPSENAVAAAVFLPSFAAPVLTRVQASPQATALATTSVAVTFGAAPIVGNAIAVAVAIAGVALTDTCTDNHGNTYTRAFQQYSAAGGRVADVYLCPAVTASGSPFTITIAGISASRLAVAMEVSGALEIDQVVGANVGGAATGTTGPTAALTGADVFVVAAIAVTGGTFITVSASVPVWVQEAEAFGPVGEVDRRILAAAVGHTQSATWALDGAQTAAMALVVFKAVAGPEPPEPEEQTFEDGAVSHPLTWITLTKKDGSKHPYSEVDLNDPPSYYDGYKRPRVERFLTIARGLSDRDGQIEHMSFGAVLSDIATDRFDSDREFRGTLADAVNKYLTNRPLEVWFIDDVERRQLGLARLAAVGYVNDYAPTADLHFEVKGADWLKKKFSRKRRAQQSWQPLITAAEFPDCPDETINSPAPLIYGSLGLGGADAVTGVTVTVNAQPTAAPASFALSLQAGGRLAGVTRYYKVSGIVGGQETIQAGPLVATTTDTNKTIRLTWTAVPSATAIYVYSSHRPDFLQFAYVKLGGGVTTYDDDTTPPNQDKRWLEGTDWILGLRINLQYYVYANLGGGLFSEPGQGSVTIPPNPPKTPATDLDRDLDITWSAHGGASGGYRIIRRRSYYSDWDPVFDRQWDVAAGVLTVTDDLITTTAVTMPSGELIAAEAAGQAEAIFVGVGSYGSTPQTLAALLVARHACARLGKIYIPQTIANVDGETEDTYAPVPDSAFGVTWFAPDHPGWIYPEKYVEINGQWFTLIFTTVEPLPDKVLVDVDGIEPVGDGTGDVIRALVDQRLHFMVNFVAPDPAWASGPYLTAADTVFPHIPAIPLVDADSHATVKAQLAARLAAGDYEGAMILGADGEFVTAVDALARFQLSGDFDQTFNRKGQDMVTCEPIEPDAAAPTIDDVLSIREGSFNLVDQVQSAFFNIIPYVHSRDYTGRERTGWYGNAEIRSEDSILNYDQEREAPVFELHAGRANTPQGSATIADVMARKLARYQDPRRVGSLQMPFEGLEYEPGSTAAITHIEGIGANGWAGREVRFIRHEVEPTTGIVRLDFYDLTAVLENHEALRRRQQQLTEGVKHGPATPTETRRPADRRADAHAADRRAADTTRSTRRPAQRGTPDAPHRGAAR